MRLARICCLDLDTFFVSVERLIDPSLQVVKGTSPESLLDTYQAERHPIGARVLRLTMAQTALNGSDERTKALRETMSDLLAMDEPRKRYAGMMSGLDIHYDLGAGHPLLRGCIRQRGGLPRYRRDASRLHHARRERRPLRPSRDDPVAIVERPADV